MHFSLAQFSGIVTSGTAGSIAVFIAVAATAARAAAAATGVAVAVSSVGWRGITLAPLE